MDRAAEQSSETHAPPGARLHFRPDIEGLRAVAIVLVVLYHAGWRRATGGFYGVDVFFVLSGFLITGILLDEVADTGTVSLMNFWARRARRLLPAAALITLMALVFSVVLETPFAQASHAYTARAFSLYASNVLFARRSANYFAPVATHDPLLHTWSLSVEEQFYLFFAPLMLGLAAWTLTHGHATFRRRFGVITVALSLLSLAGCLLLAQRYPVISFYSLPSRAWEFGLGAMTMLGVGLISRVGRPWVEALALLALAGLAASAMLPSGESRPPLGAVTLLPTLSTVGLILTGAAARPTLVARFLSTPPMRLVGRLSYSWYLWHWPVLVMLRFTVNRPSTRLSIAVALLSLLPAAATYAWIESPIRFSKGLRSRARQVVAGAVALAGVTFIAATLVGRYANETLSTPAARPIVAAQDYPRIYAEGCLVPLVGTVSPPCRYGPGTNDTTVVLLGDSHAAHWFPTIDSVTKLRGWTLINLTKTMCPAIRSTRVNALGRRYVECEAWRDSAIERVVTLRPTLVLIANAQSYMLALPDQDARTDTNPLARGEWTRGYAQVLSALVPSGARLIVLADIPNPRIDVPNCLIRHLEEPTICDASRTVAFNASLVAAERDAVKAVPGVDIISLNSFMCDSTICPVSRDGIVRYRDSNHLSVRFAASLAPELSRALTEVLARRAPSP